MNRVESVLSNPSAPGGAGLMAEAGRRPGVRDKVANNASTCDLT